MVTNQNPKLVNKLLYLLDVEFCVQVCIIVCQQRCLETHYLFDLVFKVCIICVVDHLGQTNLFCCGLVEKIKEKERNPSVKTVINLL